MISRVLLVVLLFVFQHTISKGGSKAKPRTSIRRQATTIERREQRIGKSNKNNHTSRRIHQERQHQNNKASTARGKILFKIDTTREK